MAEDREFQNSLVNHLSSLIDGMKMLNQSVANNLQTTHRFDAEFIKLSRQNMQLRDQMIEFHSQTRGDIHDIRSEMAKFRAEVNSRLDALFLRVGELENAVEGCVTQLRELAIEARSQYNEILNALQGNLQNRSAIEDLNERLEALERRFGV
jgi:polyhydroxyalkanoate synthesis regulator phasin